MQGRVSATIVTLLAAFAFESHVQAEGQLVFTENRGQVAPEVRYYARSKSQTLWFTDRGVVFDVPSAIGRVVLNQELLGSVGPTSIEPIGVAPGIYHFLRGTNDDWRTHVRSYSALVYRDVWPGIDIRVHGRGLDLEQEFVVHAGADPADIRIGYRGSEGIRLAADGSLRIRSAIGEIVERPPRIFQEVDGVRIEVQGRFKLLSESAYTFELETYRAHIALVIDPTIEVSTYIGGTAFDRAESVAIDRFGYAYIAGHTLSTDFPAVNGLQRTPAGNTDAFISKVDPSTGTLIYSTYLGGSTADRASGIAIDASGYAYVTGSTDSNTFPVANALYPSRPGNLSAFVSKVSPDGASLVYSTFLGGRTGGIIHTTADAIAVDGLGRAYITGTTTTTDFPTTASAHDRTCGTDGLCNATSDAFIVRIEPNGSALSYSSYLGGGGEDRGRAIAVDTSYNAYVTGTTTSTNFPTNAAYSAVLKGPSDAFIAKLGSEGSNLVYSTYYGGMGDDGGMGIAVDSAGNAHVTGRTSNPPVTVGPNCPDPGAFALKLNPAGKLHYARCLSGGQEDGGHAIALDRSGNAYVTGFTKSPNFPIVRAPQPSYGGGQDAFVTMLGASGAIAYSTYLGGSGEEVGSGIAVDMQSRALVTGATQSTDFPAATRPPFGSSDAFFVRLSADGLPDLTLTLLSAPPTLRSPGASFAMSANVRNQGTVSSPSSLMRFFLSLDMSKDAADVPMSIGTNVSALAVAMTTVSATAVTIPANTPSSDYFVIGCVDDADMVAESDETNNCLASTTKLGVARPDLVVSAISNPPISVVPGSTFAMNDTVLNQGRSSSTNTTTRYFLSLDALKDATDIPLSGSRPLGAIASNVSSTGTANVSPPSGTKLNRYFVIACADDANTVDEEVESNNCRSSATQVSLSGPDLIVTTVSNPPAGGSPGDTFSIASTVKNQGSAPSVQSVTRHYLSLDGMKDSTDIELSNLPWAQVPALAPSAESSISVVATVPATTPLNAYFVLTCADAYASVLELDETNNCRASATQISVTRPDLVVTAVSDPPASVTTGGSFNVIESTSNQGSANAGAFSNRYFLSLDSAKSADDRALVGARYVASLVAGASSTATTTVRVPPEIVSSTYFVIACADDGNAVAESVETNNCRVSTTTVDFRAPDLVVNSVTDPPATAAPGSSFQSTDTVANIGSATAGASTTRYYLSTTAFPSAASIPLSAARAVDKLNPAASSAGNASVIIPDSLPAGRYFLLACADGGSTVAESSEVNNCRASNGRLVSGPDLVVTSVSNPPATAMPGSSFTTSDVVVNQGPVATGVPTSMRYYLSIDGSKYAALSGSRALSSLGAGATSNGAAAVVVPGVPANNYLVLACADEPSAVPESDESNNCVVSAARVTVGGADLVTTALSNPPPVVAPGDAFSITDTVRNQGTAASAPSRTKYWLSVIGGFPPNDPVLGGMRDVPGLAPDTSSSGQVVVTVPATIASNSYTLKACADGPNDVAELNEGNNCRHSGSTSSRPDLTVTSLTNLPESAVVGNAFSVTDVVVNQGATAAAASSTKYLLSAIGSGDRSVIGTHSTPALAAGATDQASATLTLPQGTPEGDYDLLACADGANVVAESSESNNCRASVTKLKVYGPDLIVTAVSDPPPILARLDPISITDTVGNTGTSQAAVSIVRYYLSTDRLKDSMDIQIGQGRNTPVLSSGASSTGTIQAKVPIGARPASYYLIACADGDGSVPEVSEANNCRASASQVTVTWPDLMISAISDPPGDLPSGGALSVTETVMNVGSSGTLGSTARYYLSLDQNWDTYDILLTGSRDIGLLGPGVSSAGTAVAIVSNTVPANAYFLLACADDTKNVAEADEKNNCASSATKVKVYPDLAVTSVSNPPPSLVPGASFSVTDTVTNLGVASAGYSIIRYYLSHDQSKSISDRSLGQRPVPPLTVGSNSVSTTSVVFPTGIAPSAYYLLACADDSGSVTEADETNNCAAAASMATVAGPDLRVSVLSNPPASIAAGDAISVTGTVVNDGTSAAVPSTSVFFLSRDVLRSSDDVQLLPFHPVPSLDASQSSAIATTVTAPPGVFGTYFLLLCADRGNVVAETSEDNNCFASATSADIKGADLVMGSLSLVPEMIVAGNSFTVADSVTNNGGATAAASTIRYHIVPLSPGQRRPLSGSRAVASLVPGAISSGNATLNVAATTPKGAYQVFACADADGVVTEVNESNCISAVNTMTIQ